MSNADFGFSRDYTLFEVLYGIIQDYSDCVITYSGIMDFIGTRVIMKESFHEPGSGHEAEIINMVHRANGGRAEGVPRVIAHQDDRDELSIFKKVRTDETNSRPKLRRRTLFEEQLMRPTDGRSPEFLFTAAEGALDGILACIKAGIVHCNIHPLSVMLRSDEQTGVLMDYELSHPAFIQLRTTSRAQIFMSIRLLEDGRRTNTHMDDIESLFWTIVYSAIIYAKRPESMNSIQMRIFEWKDLNERMIALAKEDFLRDFEAVYIHEVNPFYACLTNGILQLKQAMFNEARGDARSMALKLKNIILQTLADLALEGSTAPSTRRSSIWA
ncbi:hypothetical protein KEM56_003107 [Ascosphaera pollenicola]|nr:hypothetical protein KEM56_003107 [Ascosphaera pollenicola]